MLRISVWTAKLYDPHTWTFSLLERAKFTAPYTWTGTLLVRTKIQQVQNNSFKVPRQDDNDPLEQAPHDTHPCNLDLPAPSHNLSSITLLDASNVVETGFSVSFIT
jgi:hypothetical protein